jgi:hypothetical protein
MGHEDRAIEKLRALGRLSKSLRGHCATCWALTGNFYVNNHKPFTVCGLDRQPSTNVATEQSMAEYSSRAFQAKFERYTACFLCWLPQPPGRNARHLYAHTDHPTPGQGCTHEFAFKEIAWVVYKTPDLWNAFLRAHDLRLFPPEITVDNYAQWLTREEVDIVGKKGIVNVGTVVFWLLRHNESSQYHSRR